MFLGVKTFTTDQCVDHLTRVTTWVQNPVQNTKINKVYWRNIRTEN